MNKHLQDLVLIAALLMVWAGVAAIDAQAGGDMLRQGQQAYIQQQREMQQMRDYHDTSRSMVDRSQRWGNEEHVQQQTRDLQMQIDNRNNNYNKGY